MLAASYALALFLPGVKAERSLWQRTANPNLVLIQEQYSVDGSLPSVSHALFKTWAGRRQKYFDGFAFYSVAKEPAGQPSLNPGPQIRRNWSVARASSNLFMLLGLPILITDPLLQPGGGMPEVILSEKAWKRDFGADPHVAGATIQLARQMVRIAGVAPDGSLELPGNVDAWMLEPDPGKLPGGAGFVIAHLTAAGVAEMWTACVHIAVNEPDDAEDDLLGVSLKEWKPQTQTLFLFALFLALVSLPAISSVSLGEYSLNSGETSWSRRFSRWMFFAVKVALLLPVVYFISLDLAFGSTAVGREQAVYIQLIATFAMSLFGLRWVLKDQRQRCPVCLCRVAHPAQVGLASRTFLDWNGTEMMCMGGHTLLHVPSLPTSWFGSQRWLYLDTSWSFLFVESAPPIA
jgi:hypothetical protein